VEVPHPTWAFLLLAAQRMLRYLSSLLPIKQCTLRVAVLLNIINSTFPLSANSLKKLDISVLRFL